MVRGSILAAAVLLALSVAHAADLNGVSMPDGSVTPRAVLAARDQLF
jgi:hypothetical protein